MTLQITREIPAAQLHLYVVVHGPGKGGVSQDFGHASPAKLGGHHSGGEVYRVRGEDVVLEIGSVSINIQGEDLTIMVMVDLIDLC